MFLGKFSFSLLLFLQEVFEKEEFIWFDGCLRVLNFVFFLCYVCLHMHRGMEAQRGVFHHQQVILLKFQPLAPFYISLFLIIVIMLLKSVAKKLIFCCCKYQKKLFHGLYSTHKEKTTLCIFHVIFVVWRLKHCFFLFSYILSL